MNRKQAVLCYTQFFNIYLITYNVIMGQPNEPGLYQLKKAELY